MTTKTRIALAVTVVLMAALAGCAGEEGESTTTPQASGGSAGVQVAGEDQIQEGVTVIVDNQRQVVCYVYRDDANDVSVGGTGGISCLPFSDVEGYGG